jgi:radical SAM superfamily enzyme YgiQ (UPF0313 family)
MKLLGVYPKIAFSVTNTHTYSAPLGLGSIGTYCRDRIGGLEFKISDGSLVSHEEQLAEVRSFQPDVVGINSTIASQKNAYEVAELAHEQGALVVFGGVNSTNLWKQMLSNREFIDVVVRHEGEFPMFAILNRLKEKGFLGNDCFKGIPNVAYRDSEGNVHPRERVWVADLDELPDIDYSLFDLDRFFEQTQRRGFGKAISYFGGKGCMKRGKVKLERFYTPEEYDGLVKRMDICPFCGRDEVGFRTLPEERETRVVRNLHDKYGVRGYFNVQDTVPLCNTSSIGLDDSWFRLFIGWESINDGNLRKLKQRYGPNIILQAGIESAAPEMRMAYGKAPLGMDALKRKAKIVADEGLKLHPSFILGGKGSTREIMQRTTEAAKVLAEYPNVTWILISPQLVLPGSPDYNALLQMPGMEEKYVNEDLIDISEISRFFMKYFTPTLARCHVIDEIKQAFDDIRQKGRDDLVLDVKGVTPEEEEYINPHRPYSEEHTEN